MKKLLRLSLSLLANQFLASVAGFMCVLFVWMLAGDSVAAQLIFLLFTFPFFLYIEYRSAFQYGFHDPDRRNNPKSTSFYWKGAAAGLISEIPLGALIITYLSASARNDLLLTAYAKLYTRICSMYYSWPMCNIFPNHIKAVFLTSLIAPFIVPMLGYIAGYRHCYISDGLLKLVKGKKAG